MGHPNVHEENGTLAVPSNFSGDFLELEERVKSMMEKSQNNYVNTNANENRKADRCKVCGKEGRGSAIKDHIEANHLGGDFLRSVPHKKSEVKTK